MAVQTYEDLKLHPSITPTGRQILSAYLIYLLGTG
jgi:hypothetical protein